jgi:hypothetical protein
MFRQGAVGLCVAVAASVASCTAVLGLGDKTFGADGAGGEAKSSTGTGGGPTTAASSGSGHAGGVANGGGATSSSTSSATTTSSTSGAATCMGTCMALPAGWSAAVAVALGPNAACPPGFPAITSTQPAVTIPPPNPAWCGCTCGTPVDCNTGTLFLDDTSTVCAALNGIFVSSMCISAGAHESAKFVPNFNTATTCKAAPTVGVPGLSIEQALVCAASEESVCPSGTGCVPAGAKYCVLAAGALSCPPGFPQRYILDPTASFQDGRGCTPCTCGPWVNPGCQGGADFYDAPGCGGNGFGVPANGACMDTSAFPIMSANLVNIQPSGGCLPSDSQPTGTVTAKVPTTVCCQ